MEAIRILLIRALNTMICLEYQYSNDFNELLVNRWCMEGESLGKHNDTQKLREDKWSHLYTVYHPDTPANRLYGSALKYGQKSHNQSSRSLDKHVLNGITKPREETKVGSWPVTRWNSYISVCLSDSLHSSLLVCVYVCAGWNIPGISHNGAALKILQ